MLAADCRTGDGIYNRSDRMNPAAAVRDYQMWILRTVIVMVVAAWPFAAARAGFQEGTPNPLPPAAAAADPKEPVPAVATAASDGTTEAAPPWAADARWYYIYVPRFRNGTPLNDPAETQPWTADWPVAAGEETADSRAENARLAIDVRARRYGGDLQGLTDRLGYLRELGVNAVCLSPVFLGAGEFRLDQVDLRHIDPPIGAKESLNEAARETSDPNTWTWTDSDRLFLALLKQAHEHGLRVVVGGVFAAVGDRAPVTELESYLLAATRRWMDPDGNGDPSDGVDGWVYSLDEPQLRPVTPPEAAFWRRWRAEVKKINPNALIVASGPFAFGQPTLGLFDVTINEQITGAFYEFFGVRGKSPDARRFLDSLAARAAEAPATTRLIAPTMLSGGVTPRLMTALAAGETRAVRTRRPSPGPKPTEDAIDRWRLATIVQHFYIGTPMTLSGDEAGMYGGPPPFVSAPMWWMDLAEPASKSPDYRGDLVALVQWLHKQREKHAPLRHGEFKTVFLDAEKSILAFARHLPGDEVILVMNYGSQKQEVKLAAGRPGQLVAVLSPGIRPRPPKSSGDASPPPVDHTAVRALRTGGSRQFVDPQGKIRLWVNPMSIRVVLVNDNEPR